MARLILKSPYLKCDGSRSVSGYLRYIGTRERVELLPDDRPPTRKQEQLVRKLTKDFPEAKELGEYLDYESKPTKAIASAFITRALEESWAQVQQSEGYMKYIATRPRAERLGDHGLFGDEDGVDLEQAMRELDQYTGNVWTHILSLKREDAARLGYDNAKAWMNLLRANRNDIAAAMNIPPNHFRWYAAYHDEGEHPHVHMMVWSDDPRMGHLTKKGIFAMRSKLTGTIFREELKDVYIRKESIYKRSIQTAQEKLLELTAQMEQRTCPDTGIEQMMLELSQQLSQLSGKHQYGYLPKPVKATVDAIVDRLAQLPEVAACYAQWNQVKDELVRFHNQNPRQHLPLSQQKEFRVLLNAVIREAEHIRLTEDPAAKTAEQAPLPPPIAVAERPRDTVAAQNTSILPATLRLLHHLGNIFHHDALISPATLRIDSKRRRRLQEKRMAMGHKRDDHEEAQRQEQMTS